MTQMDVENGDGEWGLTEARTQKEGLRTGDLLDHFETIDF